MTRPLLPHPLLTPALALVWLLLVNEFALGQLLLGLALGWAIPIFTLPFWPERLRVRRPLRLLGLLPTVLGDLLIANLTVAGLILAGPRRTRPAFVTVPLELRTEFAISLLTTLVSLTPGTVAAWLSPDRTRLIVHGLRVTDAAALVATIKRRYEQPLREVFESC